MNIYKLLESEVKSIIGEMKQSGALPDSVDSARVEATPTRDASHGDVATNAAMVLAAQAGKNPREIAGLLLPKLSALASVEKAEIAGPGFINLTLKNEVWQSVILDILKSGIEYGTSAAGAGQKVNVEYVSANPTGPMHVGHARGAVYGDALAGLLQKAGYGVTKEYYINDAGAQVATLVESVFLRYREALGENIGEIPAGMYPGDYLVPVAKKLVEELGNSLLEKNKEDRFQIIRPIAVAAMMEMIRDDLALLGIHHDVFTSEYELTQAGRVEQSLAELEKRGLIYVGVLEPPKGKAPEDWEPRPQTLFKSSQFGDDCDRPIKKSDGSWTYFTPDIAYHYDKVRRGHTKLVDVFGADHGGYAKRIQAAVAALTDGKVPVEIKLCQLVKFLRGGKEAKMSKRAGTFVTVREVVEEVGRDVFRFIMLTRKNDAPLDFDFEKVMEQSKDNPVFYVQYAHARAQSVLRNMQAELPEAVKLAGKADAALLARLNTPAELQFIRVLAQFPRMVETAAAHAEPHRIAFYLHDLAAEFHGLWNRGNEEISLRFIVKDDIALSAARAALARALAHVVAAGLKVLGVTPMDEMR